MKVLGKIWKFLVLLLIILLVAAVLIPYIYQDEIKEALKDNINEAVDAEVDFSDVNLSLFKSFPKVALDVNDLRISGKEQFEGVDLLKAKTIRLNADLSTVFKQDVPINISSIEINDADLNIVIDKKGRSNYDIYESSSNTDTTEFVMHLENYTVTDSDISYKDLSSDFDMELEQIDHSGSGNFTADIFDLVTETKAERFSMSSAGVPYFSKVKVQGTNKIVINNDKNSYTFNENKLKLNALDVDMDGTIFVNDDINMDLKMAADDASFGEFISLLPNTYKGDIANLNSKGKAQVHGKVKGSFKSEKNRYPAYDFDVKINDGYVQFPDAPKPIEDVNMDIKVASSGGTNYKVTIPEMEFRSGENYIDGNLNYNSNGDNPTIKSELDGKLDLKDLSQSFPMDGISTLNGIVDITDLKIDTDLESIKNEQYDKIEFEGDVLMSGIDILMDDTPEIKMDKLAFKANPKSINISDWNLDLGKSDLNIKGDIENPLAYFFPEQSVQGKLDVNSKSIDLNEWLSEEETESSTMSLSKELEKLTRSSGLDVRLKADEIKYYDYTLIDNSFEGSVTGETVDIEKYDATLYDNDFNLTGKLTGLYDFVMNNEVMTGKLVMESDKFDVNPFLESEDSTAVAEIYRVPLNLDLEIITKLKDVAYQKMNFDQMNGSVVLQDGAIKFNEVVSKALGGEMNFEGLYDSKVAEPLFSLKYDMSKVSFQETFSSMPSVQKLAGIIKYIEGFFNSTLVMEANLNDKMFPNLSTLNAEGFIETITGKLGKFGPLNEMSDKLGLKQFDKVDLSNTKNWFEIKNGTVGLKPETYTFDDIEMIVSGNHAYNSAMSYTILAKIPRSKFDENAVTGSINDGWKYLEDKAGKIGLDIGQGEFVNLRIDLGGTLLKPLIDITPVGTEGRSLKQQVKDEVTQKVNDTRDTIIQIANEKVEVIKDTVTTVVENKIDTLADKVEEEINSQIDTLQNKVEEKIEEKVDTIVGDLLNETLDTLLNDKLDTLVQGQLEDILGDKKKEEVDKIKDKIKDWNPFKKKGG